ncbi:hypothetical protein AVEN_88701-1 [Araneus ventricosus]|uniref:Uncharacterized protein n=1 Tax=Araneus ventricosus TaxID=182803 RepID=A0A4Y2VFF2_ARAVE|nr:hypothetical protein AVEN_88701-1 [Araneus ventricosus]
MSKNKFLGNDANKDRLIRMLKTKFEAENFMVKQATGTCDNSQVPSHDSDEVEKTETVFEQTYNGIENEEDPNEYDNPIADDAEKISVCDVSIDTEDDEPATPGPSRTAKRRRLF